MSQSNETPQEVLLKVKKIKALAERGIGGEKETPYCEENEWDD